MFQYTDTTHCNPSRTRNIKIERSKQLYHFHSPLPKLGHGCDVSWPRECNESGSWFIRLFRHRRRIRRHESTFSPFRCLLYINIPRPNRSLSSWDPCWWLPSNFDVGASRPSAETIGSPMMSLSWDPLTFHAWKMSNAMNLCRSVNR